MAEQNASTNTRARPGVRSGGSLWELGFYFLGTSLCEPLYWSISIGVFLLESLSWGLSIGAFLLESFYSILSIGVV